MAFIKRLFTKLFFPACTCDQVGKLEMVWAILPPLPSPPTYEATADMATPSPAWAKDGKHAAVKEELPVKADFKPAMNTSSSYIPPHVSSGSPSGSHSAAGLRARLGAAFAPPAVSPLMPPPAAVAGAKPAAQYGPFLDVPRPAPHTASHKAPLGASAGGLPAAGAKGPTGAGRSGLAEALPLVLVKQAPCRKCHGMNKKPIWGILFFIFSSVTSAFATYGLFKYLATTG